MALNGPLVSTTWLADRLGDPMTVVLDGSWHMPSAQRDAPAEFAAGHIPGAAFFGIDEICDHSSELPHMLADPGEFATAVRRLSVFRDSHVVIYDTLGLSSAGRVWWNFRAMGHQAVSVLDGGLPRWTSEGRALESGWPSPPHGDFKARPAPALTADLEAMRRFVATGDSQILDARAADRFSGDSPEPREGLKRGHMPGALNVPWTTFVRGGSLVPPEEIAALFAAANVDLGKPIVTTCGSGITAALLALALNRLGRDDVAVYDGSWSEWGSRPDTPAAIGPA